jgi:hypothetical protein
MEVNKEIFLESQGKITQLPDSQRIFGKLIYKFSESSGYMKARKFVSLVKTKEIFCMVSNFYPKDYIFTPFVEYGNKEIYKSIKDKKFIKTKNIFIDDNLNVSKLCEASYVISKKHSQQRSSLINQRDILTFGYENELFTVPYITYNTNIEGRVIKNFIFNIYIKCETKYDSLVEEFLKMINNLKEEEYHSFGKRSSQGYNVYKVIKICDIRNKIQEKSYYLNMGMLLPDFSAIDIQNSVLKIYTSERRPYSQIGFWDKKNFIPYFISFIMPGSIIKLKNGKNIQNVGKCIESEYDKSKDSIIFGNSYLISKFGGIKYD